jgi:hypothetical protein
MSMAYDQELADRVRVLIDDESVVEKAMFGGLAFLVAGNMSVAASGHGGLLVRVDPAVGDDLLAEPGVEQFEVGGRGPMKGWLRVSLEVLVDDTALERWVRRGVSYAGSLPAK